MREELDQHLQTAARSEVDGDVVAALRAWRAALAIDPACVPALLGVARASLLLGHVDRAVEDLTRVLLAQRDCAEAYLGRGQAFLELGLFERARTDLEAALRLEPESVDVHLALGQLHGALGETQAAVDALREAQRLCGEGGDADVALELALALLATLEPRTLADDALVTELRHAVVMAEVGLGEDDPLVAVARAGLEAASGRTEGATRRLVEALEREPELEERVASMPLLAALLAG